MAKVEKVTQITHNRFLNYFELSTIKRTGKAGRYFMAARSDDVSTLDLTTGQNTPNGVVIFSLAGEKHDRIVLVHQYRYPIAGYVYELPAGLLLSMIGTPFFILVLMRRGIRGKRHD
jgi:ADP-ribose pyrophosphatase